MTQINIGGKIRELRKKKGITQEALAAILLVSPQAVSKWEMGLTYPDMAMIPAIARYFEVSLDALFEYDVTEIKAKIEEIEKEAREYFFNDPKRYVEIIKTALKDYPGNEDLLYDLLNIYNGYDFTAIDGNDHLDEAVEIANRLISTSNNYPMVCWAKERLAGIYLRKGEYDRAKSMYESLPNRGDVPTKHESMAFNLSAKDKLNAAVWMRCGNLEDLYIACMKEGDAWFNMDQHPEVTFRDYTPAEYIPEAMKCYRKGLRVLETFLVTEYGYEAHDQYLWEGMQTFHWSFHQCLAACYKKLGQIVECEKEIDEAYRIISTAWKDFNENRAYYMEPFNRYLKDYNLGEYVK